MSIVRSTSAGDQDCCYHGSLFISTLYLDDFLFSLVIFFGYANQLSLLYIDTSDMYQQHVAMSFDGNVLIFIPITCFSYVVMISLEEH